MIEYGQSPKRRSESSQSAAILLGGGLLVHRSQIRARGAASSGAHRPEGDRDGGTGTGGPSARYRFESEELVGWSLQDGSQGIWRSSILLATRHWTALSELAIPVHSIREEHEWISRNLPGWSCAPTDWHFMARECSTRSSALSSNGLFDRHRYAQILPSQKPDNLHCFHICREALWLTTRRCLPPPAASTWSSTKSIDRQRHRTSVESILQDCSPRGPRDGTRLSRAASHRSRRPLERRGLLLAYWLSCSPAAQ